MTTRSPELVEAISATLVQQPFFAVLLMDLMEVHESDTVIGHDRANNTAYTDGTKIVINPAFFKTLTVKERMFVLAHEITHVILQHPARMKGYADMGFGPDLKPFSGKRFNIAADYIINAYLNELKVGAQPVGTLLNGQFSSADLADDVYLKIPEDEDDEGWDQHEVPADASKLPAKGAIQRAVASAAAAQKSMGKMSGGMQRLVDSILEPQVHWAEHLRSAIVAKAGTSEQTWNRPNRRRLAMAPHIYWPGKCGAQSEPVALEIDTSGSIGDVELRTFLSEIHGIMSDVSPEVIYAMYVDSELFNDEVIEITDVSEVLDLGKKAGGGGGTDMTVVFREIEKRELKVGYVVILTDGYTPFGEDTGIPTIWCMTTSVVAPWGTTVHIKVPTA